MRIIKFQNKREIKEIVFKRKTMSRQLLDLNKDWSKIKEKFREHFQVRNINITDNQLKYEKSGEKLVIDRNGEVTGSMPLHESELKASEVIFRENEIKLISDDSKYVYRR